MKRVLSSIGIGAATVDTILPETELTPGETVEVDVEMVGGDSTQEIEGIYFALKTSVGGETVVIGRFDAAEAFSLSPDERRAIPVEITIPPWTPITRGDATVWLETGLDIDWARDPTDEDAIEVVPDAFVAALFEAVEELGFAFSGSELESADWLDDQPFVQEFEFRPRAGETDGSLEEITLACVPRGDDLRVFVGFDKDDPVEHLSDQDFDEQEVALTFTRADADMMRRRLRNNVRRHT